MYQRLQASLIVILNVSLLVLYVALVLTSQVYHVGRYVTVVLGTSMITTAACALRSVAGSRPIVAARYVVFWIVSAVLIPIVPLGAVATFLGLLTGGIIATATNWLGLQHRIHPVSPPATPHVVDSLPSPDASEQDKKINGASRKSRIRKRKLRASIPQKLLIFDDDDGYPLEQGPGANELQRHYRR